MLNISEPAKNRISEILATKKEQLYLRVYIQGGGCSGFQYGFQLETDCEEMDILVEDQQVKVIVDPLSMQYLEGAQVDFKDDLMGSRFIVNNPNAATTCGCGASFST